VAINDVFPLKAPNAMPLLS